MTNWRNIVARCRFLVASLNNLNDAAHSMAQPLLNLDICDRCLIDPNICYIYQKYKVLSTEDLT